MTIVKHSFILLLYSLNTSYMLGSVLGTGNRITSVLFLSFICLGFIILLKTNSHYSSVIIAVGTLEAYKRISFFIYFLPDLEI